MATFTKRSQKPIARFRDHPQIHLVSNSGLFPPRKGGKGL